MVREAKPEDLHRVMELYAQLHPNDPVLEDVAAWRAYDEILATPNLYLFVLDDGGAVEATCYFNFIPNITRQASPYAIIENVVTEVSRRNQGLGKKLLGHVLQFA